MIDLNDVQNALKKASPLFDELHRLYDRLPATACDCDRPGKCCVFMPEMTFVEALNWTRIVFEAPAAERRRLLRRFVAFYMTSPVAASGCPFLDDTGGCTNYAHRSFACRAYGQWSLKMGRRRTADHRNQRAAFLKMWKAFEVDISPEQLTDEIDYCPKVDIVSGAALGDQELLELIRKIHSLDGPLDRLRQSFETEYHSDASFLITALQLGYKKAVLGKFAVIKEWVEHGSSNRLDRFLEKI
jgi:Fe-S-cluster containining protein